VLCDGGDQFTIRTREQLKAMTISAAPYCYYSKWHYFFIGKLQRVYTRHFAIFLFTTVRLSQTAHHARRAKSPSDFCELRLWSHGKEARSKCQISAKTIIIAALLQESAGKEKPRQTGLHYW
jgi:hypothetical protein